MTEPKPRALASPFLGASAQAAGPEVTVTPRIASSALSAAAGPGVPGWLNPS